MQQSEGNSLKVNSYRKTNAPILSKFGHINHTNFYSESVINTNKAQDSSNSYHPQQYKNQESKPVFIPMYSMPSNSLACFYNNNTPFYHFRTTSFQDLSGFLGDFRPCSSNCLVFFEIEEMKCSKVIHFGGKAQNENMNISEYETPFLTDNGDLLQFLDNVLKKQQHQHTTEESGQKLNGEGNRKSETRRKASKPWEPVSGTISSKDFGVHSSTLEKVFTLGEWTHNEKKALLEIYSSQLSLFSLLVGQFKIHILTIKSLK